MSTFADTKLTGAPDSLEGQDTFKMDLDKLECWATINWMKLDKPRCWVLHSGWSKTRHKYKLGEKWQVIIRLRIEGIARKSFVLSQFREATEQISKVMCMKTHTENNIIIQRTQTVN